MRNGFYHSFIPFPCTFLQLQCSCNNIHSEHGNESFAKRNLGSKQFTKEHTYLYLFLIAILFTEPLGRSSPVFTENVVVKMVKRFTWQWYKPPISWFALAKQGSRPFVRKSELDLAWSTLVIEVPTLCASANAGPARSVWFGSRSGSCPFATASDPWLIPDWKQ